MTRGLQPSENSDNLDFMSSFFLVALSLRTSASAIALILGGLLLLRPARR